MKQIATILTVLVLFFSCMNSKSDKKILSKNNYKVSIPSEAQLIEHIKKAIKPQFTDWVIFSNGTYLVITADSATPNLKNKAIDILKEYGPVYPGSPSGDISITKLSNTEGWVVGGDYEGMYTYVHPTELKYLEFENPKDIDIGLYGRKKREKDAKELKVVYVNQ